MVTADNIPVKELSGLLTFQRDLKRTWLFEVTTRDSADDERGPTLPDDILKPIKQGRLLIRLLRPLPCRPLPPEVPGIGHRDGGVEDVEGQRRPRQERKQRPVREKGRG